MKNKMTAIVTVLAATIIGVSVYVVTNDSKKSNEESETTVSEPTPVPRARTREEIKDRMKQRLEEAKIKAMAMRDEMKGKRGPNTNGYVPGSAAKTRKSSTELDEILEQGNTDEVRSSESRQMMEAALKARPKLSGAKVEQADCVDSFCRVVFTYKDPASMASFQQEMEEDSLMKDRHRFSFTQSKITLSAGAKLPTSIPMETRLYYSNSGTPLPMDETLQQEPEA